VHSLRQLQACFQKGQCLLPFHFSSWMPMSVPVPLCLLPHPGWYHHPAGAACWSLPRSSVPGIPSSGHPTFSSLQRIYSMLPFVLSLIFQAVVPFVFLIWISIRLSRVIFFKEPYFQQVCRKDVARNDDEHAAQDYRREGNKANPCCHGQIGQCDGKNKSQEA